MTERNMLWTTEDQDMWQTKPCRLQFSTSFYCSLTDDAEKCSLPGAFMNKSQPKKKQTLKNPCNWYYWECSVCVNKCECVCKHKPVVWENSTLVKLVCVTFHSWLSLTQPTPLVWFLPTDSVNYFAFFILRELWEMPLTTTAVPPRTLQQLLA